MFDICRKYNLRETMTRHWVLGTIFLLGDEFTPDSVYKAMKKAKIKIGKASVYNVIRFLAAWEIIIITPRTFKINIEELKEEENE